MNKLLERQLKKLYGDIGKVPSGISSLLESISNTYDGFDQDRDLTIRSLELSSSELLEANKKIREEAERQKAILEALRSATAALRPSSDSKKDWLTSADEVMYLAKSLSELIGEQKKHEKELEESKAHTEEEKAKAEAILQSIGDGVFAVDLNCKIMLMNPIAEMLSGYSFSESIGRNYKEIFKFVKEQDEESIYPPFVEDVVKTGKIKAMANHTLLIKKDQTKFPVSDSAAPIKDKNGNIFGCIVVMRDASRERELERAKDDFISIAAHQLRTPLGSIRWTLEMLNKDQALSPSTKDKIGRVYVSNQRLITLVNDLLNVSRIDQGRVQDDPQPTDVYEVIREASQELDPICQQRKVSIDLQLQDNQVPKIVIDPKRIREVIQNVISNAVKYSTPGGKITVSALKEEKFVKISVADEGIGIPQVDQQRVFTKFYRAENAARSDTTGSGLGLFVVKSYVEAWGGKVTFRSIEGKGTTFILEIPFEVRSITAATDDSKEHYAEGISSPIQ